MRVNELHHDMKFFAKVRLKKLFSVALNQAKKIKNNLYIQNIRFIFVIKVIRKNK